LAHQPKTTLVARMVAFVPGAEDVRQLFSHIRRTCRCFGPHGRGVCRTLLVQ
jgi:hypothetical protein